MESAEAAKEVDLLTQCTRVFSSGTTLVSAISERSRLPEPVRNSKRVESRQNGMLHTELKNTLEELSK